MQERRCWAPGKRDDPGRSRQGRGRGRSRVLCCWSISLRCAARTFKHLVQFATLCNGWHYGLNGYANEASMRAAVSFATVKTAPRSAPTRCRRCASPEFLPRPPARPRGRRTSSQGAAGTQKKPGISTSSSCELDGPLTNLPSADRCWLLAGDRWSHVRDTATQRRGRARC